MVSVFWYFEDGEFFSKKYSLIDNIFRPITDDIMGM